MKLWTVESKLEEPLTVKSLHKPRSDSLKNCFIHKKPVCNSSRYYLHKWIFAEKSEEYLLLQSEIENWEFESHYVIRNHSKVLVTIAVLLKNSVDSKSTSLAKSFITNLYDTMCSYIKKRKIRHFLGNRSIVVCCGELLKHVGFLVRYFMLGSALRCYN